MVILNNKCEAGLGSVILLLLLPANDLSLMWQCIFNGRTEEKQEGNSD